MTKIYTGNDVSINGVTLNRIDENGCSWVLTDIDGWWGLPDLEIFDDPKTYTQDGSYFAGGRYQARQITVTGVILPGALGVEGSVMARNALNSALNMVRSTGELILNETPHAKMANVQVSSRPLTNFNNSKNVLEFNIQLRAADPRKYSTSDKFMNIFLPEDGEGRRYPKTYSFVYGEPGTDGVSATENEGNYDTNGTFRINGPVENPQITHVESGKTLYFNITLGIDEYLDVDLQYRTAFFQTGSSGRGVILPASQWFLINAGANTFRFDGHQTIPARDYSPASSNLVLNPNMADSNTNGVVDGVLVSANVSASQVITFDGPDSHRNAKFTRTDDQPAYINIGNNVGYESPVAQNTTYTGSVWVRSTSGTTVTAQIVAPNGTTGPSSVPFNLLPSEWTRVYVTGATATGQATAALKLLWSSADIHNLDAAGETLEVSSAMLVPGSLVFPYFDGNSPYANWTGSANQSTSFQTEITQVPKAMVQLTHRDAWIY